MVMFNFNRPKLVSERSGEEGTPLSYALRYAALGWFVLPVWNTDEHGNCRCGKRGHAEGHRPGKHPQGVLVPRGLNDASNDPEVIREWYTRDPEAGVGVQMSRSGLVALDVDPRNGGDDTLEELEAEHGVLYSNCEASTQGGGIHRIFKAEDEADYGKTLGAGIDLIHSTYICVEPTRGESGVYRWTSGLSPLQGAQPSPLPAAVREGARTAGSRYNLTESGGVPVATAQTFEDLKSALQYISADAYDTWVKVGLALKPYGEAGYAAWVEWSATSQKFSAVEARKKWDRALSQPDTITYKTVFYMALQNNWSGSSSGASKKDEHTVDTLNEFKLEPLTYSELQNAHLTPRVILPYMLYADVRTRIAAGGVGKTTLALYEAITLALGRELWGRQPDEPVRTVIVTREDARETLAARTREIMKGLELDRESIDQVLSNLIIMDLSTVGFRISAVVGDVVTPHVENLGWLVKHLREFKPDWMIMDPLVSFGVGEQRVNDAEQGLIEAMRILKKEFNCCVEGIHHSGKANAREKTLDQYSGRGGSALADGARMVCVLAPMSPAEFEEATGQALQESESALVMAMPKMSYCRPQTELYIKRSGYLFEAVVGVVAPAQADVHKQIDSSVYGVIREAWLKNEPMSKEDLRSDFAALFYGALKRNEVTEAVARLQRDGLIVQRRSKGGRGQRAVLEPVVLNEDEVSKYSMTDLPRLPRETPPSGAAE